MTHSRTSVHLADVWKNEQNEQKPQKEQKSEKQEEKTVEASVQNEYQEKSEAVEELSVNLQNGHQEKLILPPDSTQSINDLNTSCASVYSDAIDSSAISPFIETITEEKEEQ